MRKKNGRQDQGCCQGSCLGPWSYHSQGLDTKRPPGTWGLGHNLWPWRCLEAALLPELSWYECLGLPPGAMIQTRLNCCYLGSCLGLWSSYSWGSVLKSMPPRHHYDPHGGLKPGPQLVALLESRAHTDLGGLHCYLGPWAQDAAKGHVWVHDAAAAGSVLISVVGVTSGDHRNHSIHAMKNNDLVWCFYTMIVSTVNSQMSTTIFL